MACTAEAARLSDNVSILCLHLLIGQQLWCLSVLVRLAIASSHGTHRVQVLLPSLSCKALHAVSSNHA